MRECRRARGKYAVAQSQALQTRANGHARDAAMLLRAESDAAEDRVRERIQFLIEAASRHT